MSRAVALVGILSIALMAGCIGTDDTNTDGGAIQITAVPDSMLADLPATITGLDLLGVGQAAVPTAAGIWVHGDYAYSGGRSAGFFITDISDPANPVLVGSLNGTDDEAGGVYARDVDLISYDDGRLVAVLAGQGLGMYFVDVTDPTMPRLLSTIPIEDIDKMATHNVDVVPGTSYVFNAPSGGIGRTNHLIDAADPENPKVVTNVGEHGCHDISFYVNEAENKSRAYCAGRDNTEIWDISDLHQVKIITQLNHPVLDNGGGLHHLAMVNQDATLLILGDEFRGGGGPGCQAHTPAGSTPVGALWFFDITGDKELAPEELGSFSPTMPIENTLAHNPDYTDRVTAWATSANPETSPTSAPQPDSSCTSHFGNYIEDTPILAMGWYHAGIILIDTTDGSSPQQVGQFDTGTNTWDVKYHRGVLVSGDMARGLDVFKLV